MAFVIARSEIGRCITFGIIMIRMQLTVQVVLHIFSIQELDFTLGYHSHYALLSLVALRMFYQNYTQVTCFVFFSAQSLHIVYVSIKLVVFSVGLLQWTSVEVYACCMCQLAFYCDHIGFLTPQCMMWRHFNFCFCHVAA